MKLGALGAFLALSLVEPVAHAANACEDAYENGQRARLDRDLTRAKSELQRCAQTDCASIIQQDCGEWLREVERAIPTLIVSARWADGSDIVDAKITVDQKPISERLDGKPFAVNPGEHRVRIEANGASSEQVVVAIQGEHDRVLRFTLAHPPRKAAPPVADQKPVEDHGASSGAGPLPWVLAGVSVAALAGFGYYAYTGRADLRDLRHDCAPTCKSEQLDDVKRKLLVADILLGVAVVSGGTSAYLFISGGRHSDEARVGVAGHF